MGSGRILRNDFSWSNSRHEKLRECLRAYYFTYYASWGGWENEAPPEIRRLYILKKLSNRYTWAGSVVHAVVRDALRDTRAQVPVHSERFIERAHRQMREDYRHSHGKRYWREKRRRDFHGLVEHEYSEPVGEEEWRRNWEAVKGALTWFFNSRWLQVAQALRPEQWLEVDDNDFERSAFAWDGVKVFAIPDFAYVDDEGAPVVVDWKTGKPRDGYDAQVLGYALYVAERYGLPFERVRTSLVYLNEGTEREVRADPAALEGFRRHFAESVARMRSLLADVEGNIPRSLEAFPMIEDGPSCARCAFRSVCGRGMGQRPSVLFPRAEIAASVSSSI